MPLLWRYSIGQFLKIVLASMAAFIAILLTMRLDEIAHFAALGAPLSYLLLFTLYQIPYILPIALPLSCLIASLIFMHRLSQTHELTVLRASGFSLRDLLTPLLLTAAFLSLGNFWIISEIATQSHLQTNLLKSELRSVNPLLLLHNKHLMRLKGLYFEPLGPSHVGESASDVIFAIPNKHQKRLTLFIAQQLKTSSSVFIAQGVTLLTSTASEQDKDYDNLLIENMEESVTQVDDFSEILQKKVWTINNDYLKLPLLMIRSQEQRKALRQAQKEGADRAEIKQLKSQLNRSLTEITKRISIACAVLSLTLMGIAFGIHIGRQHKSRNLTMVIALTTFYLVSFFVAKGVDQSLVLSSVLYMAPLFLIILISLFALRRVSRGIE